MQEYKFNVTGEDRKRLVSAISEVLNQPMKYLSAPSFAYEVGEYRVDKYGTVTGGLNSNLLETLSAQGFTCETDEKPDRLAIKIPLDGFTPESIENLLKIVKAKENLLKIALGTDEVPIEVLEDRICFPWFNLTEKAEHINAYTQLISLLCKTAKGKKHINAKVKVSFENEKFSMRVWLILPGCIGKDYTTLRKIMGENLSGNSAFRYGKPQKQSPDTAESEVQNNE